jgi:nucleoside-diphosphate-sugar epimerase
MKKVMIIGAGGQIGHDLVPLLFESGYELTLVDRRDTEGSRMGGILDRLYGVGKWQERWRVLDATKEGEMGRLLREVRPEGVFHLAALLSARCEQDPDECWQVNMTSFKTVLDVLDELSGDGFRPRLIWPSSIAAFGQPYDTPGQPYSAENEYPLLPRTMYGVTKVACEMLGAYYAAKKGVDFRSVRFPGLLNTTPPGGGSSDYANAMYFGAATGEKEAVSFVGPDARIPFMYMGDAVRALLLLAEAEEKRLTRRTYNIKSFSAPTAAQIAESIMAEMPGFSVRYEPDERERNVRSWPQDFEDIPARHDWDWRPEVDTLGKMTRRLLADFRAMT